MFDMNAGGMLDYESEIMKELAAAEKHTQALTEQQAYRKSQQLIQLQRLAGIPPKSGGS